MKIKDIKKEQWIEWIGAAFLFVAIVAAIIVGVSDKNNWGVSATILLSTIAAYFIYSILKEQAISVKIDKSVQTLLNAILNSIDDMRKIKNIKTFNNIQDVDDYLIKKIEQAKETFCDLTWQDDFRGRSVRDEFRQRKIDNELKRCFQIFCSDSSRSYREIFTFSEQENISAMEHHFKNGGDAYRCKYFDNKKHSKFPKLQFVIIDGKEIIFALGDYRPNFYAIADENFINIFKMYFDDAWNEGLPIENQTDIDKIKNLYCKKTK